MLSIKPKFYAHIDCNNFFASCERLFRPELEGRPVAVLSNNDGCIIARSQEVKALGVPMGIPLFKVKPLVKSAGVTLFSANFELYGDISERIVTLLRQITPLIEVYSIDECFLDLSKLEIEDYAVWAASLRRRVLKEVGVPVSIGVATTKTLAKVATNHAKKHGGVSVIATSGERERILSEVPVEDIWGVGWRTAPKLKDCGVSTALQLVSASDAWLKSQFNIAGLRMVDELRGQPRLKFGDSRDKRQSIMVSRAFGHRVREYHQLESALANFTARAAAKLRGQQSVCSRVAVYLTTSRYDEQVRSVSKSATLPEPSGDTGSLLTCSLSLLEELYDPDFSYTKVAVILLDIVDVQAWQLSLMQPAQSRDRKLRLMNGVDRINARFGSSTIWHAAEDRANAGWHSKHALRSPRYTTSWTELPKVGL